MVSDLDWDAPTTPDSVHRDGALFPVDEVTGDRVSFGRALAPTLVGMAVGGVTLLVITLIRESRADAGHNGTFGPGSAPGGPRQFVERPPAEGSPHDRDDPRLHPGPRV